MSYMMLLAHPNSDSLNHSIVDRIITALGEEGHPLWYHDLYGEHFQPVLENEEMLRRFSFDELYSRYAREVREAQGFILVYPDWWGMPPAILKGWIDRIFRPGVAYEFAGEEFMPKEKVPLLSGKKALIIVTTNETNPLSQEAMCTLWQERVFGYVGIDDVTFRILYGVRDARRRERRRWLDDIDELVRRWA